MALKPAGPFLRGRLTPCQTPRMHEFALAESVVRAVIQTAEAEGLTAVTRVAVQVGELQSIKQDVFEFALEQVRTDDPRLANTVMEVEIVPARLRCRDCEHVFTLAETGERDATAKEAIHFVPELAHAFMRCPSCASPDFEVVDGRGVGITTIEGDKPDA